MSRQRGRRERPAPERREFRERYSRSDRRRDRAAASRLTDSPQWTNTISPGRRWAAVLAGTVVAVTAFALVAAGVVEAADGSKNTAAWFSAGAAVLVPVFLLVVGFVSRAATPWQTTAFASPIVVFLFLIGALLARDPATGFVLGVGVGGALAMRIDDGVHTRSSRIWMSVALAVYTKIVYLASPGVAIVAAPLLPLAGIGVIDRMRERTLNR